MPWGQAQDHHSLEHFVKNLHVQMYKNQSVIKDKKDKKDHWTWIRYQHRLFNEFPLYKEKHHVNRSQSRTLKNKEKSHSFYTVFGAPEAPPSSSYLQIKPRHNVAILSSAAADLVNYLCRPHSTLSAARISPATGESCQLTSLLPYRGRWSECSASEFMNWVSHTSIL